LEVTQKTINELKWIPLERVGPFKFGCSIKEYVQKYGLVNIPEEYNEKVDWEVYKFCEGDRIYTENGRIISVLCSSNCLYKGRNLIGMPIDQIQVILGCKPDNVEMLELSDGPQKIYDFEKLGLQLWVMGGNVVTALLNDGE